MSSQLTTRNYSFNKYLSEVKEFTTRASTLVLATTAVATTNFQLLANIFLTGKSVYAIKFSLFIFRSRVAVLAKNLRVGTYTPLRLTTAYHG